MFEESFSLMGKMLDNSINWFKELNIIQQIGVLLLIAFIFYWVMNLIPRIIVFKGNKNAN